MAGEPDAGYGPGPLTPFPDISCPGGPGCTGEGDGVFRVGAARASIDPDLVETEWEDENGNGERDSGEAFTDVNGNGKFDAVWMAGFGNGRPARGFNDALWVKALVLEWNDIRLGIVVFDSVGVFITEFDKIRDALPASLELDHVLFAATHVHEGPDTIGLWGEKELVSGVDLDYMARLRERGVEAITAAVGKLEPVVMSVSQIDTVDDSGSSKPFVGDNRDPVIIDLTLTALRFESINTPGTTVATLVNWAAHPEYAGSENNYLSADYVHYLRDAIENGVAENAVRGLPAITGIGGEVIFANGALGGQIGPGGGTRPIGADGLEVESSGIPRAEAAGTNVGRLALEAMNSASMTKDVAAPTLAVRSGRISAIVENTFYHVAALVDVFDRSFSGYDETRPIGEGNLPYLETRVTYVQIGSVGIAGVPGEPHPELMVGGYDGSRSYGREIVDPSNPNPPPLADAPEGPYVADLVKMNPGVEYALCFGLAEDFMGYIVPAYNYKLDDNYPYIEEADGDHYEETNSIGPKVEEQIIGPLRELINLRP